MTEPLTRIGAPLPARRPKGRQRIWLLWIPVAVIALGLASVAGGYILAGGPEPIRELLGMETKAADSTSSSVETQIECANIKHAHTVWRQGSLDIVLLESLPSDFASIKVRDLGAQGKTFLDAVTGHKDQPSKRLATAIAEYNYHVSLLGIELIGGAFKGETYEQAIKSSDAVDAAYRDFAAATCA